MSAGRIHVGTSGWSYAHWKGPFYPEHARDESLLGLYAQHFGSVEINASFYRLPAPEVFAAWREAVPEGFVFAVKASRYITHLKKLREPEKTLPPFLEHALTLGEKLGPVLFQLPPRWGFDPQRLEHFLAALPHGLRCAFELRDASWWNPRALELLAGRNAAFCIHDLNGRVSPESVTADFAYVRLHGPDGAYRGSYDRRALAHWAERLTLWSREGRDVFCYFDNDELGHAARNAGQLLDMIRK